MSTLCGLLADTVGLLQVLRVDFSRCAVTVWCSRLSTRCNGLMQVAMAFSTHQNMVLLGTAMKTVHSLPPECISSILSFLPMKHLLCHTSRVCKLWKQALQHPICWSSIDLKHKDLTSSLNTIKRHLPIMFGPSSCVTSLRLEQPLIYNPLNISSCMSIAADLASNLSSMSDMQHVSLKLLHNFTDGLSLAWPNLVNLNISGPCLCLLKSGIVQQRIDLSACPSLQCATIQARFVPLTLVVRGLMFLSQLDVTAVINEIEGLFNLHSLSYLRLCGLGRGMGLSVAREGINRSIQPEIDAIFPCLVRLDLVKASKEVATMFLRNAPCMPCVASLCLPPGVHMPELGYMAALTRLTSLTIGEEDHLTDGDMQAIGSVATLRDVWFVGFSCGLRLNDELGGDVDHFAQRFPLHALCSMPSCKIQRIHFHRCAGLVGPALQPLHMLSCLKGLALVHCNNIGSLPSSLARCGSLESLTFMVNTAIANTHLSLPNAQVIASIPRLKNAYLPPPSSQECLHILAECPMLNADFQDPIPILRARRTRLPHAVQRSANLV